MGLKHFLLGTSLLCGLVISPALSHAADSLSPRAEVSVKGGSERSTLTTEFWAPLAQKSDRVVYTDLRLMGDDDDNREGNLGIGYRQIYAPTNSVLGIHGWIDRRRTEHNSTFHQATFGVESLGDKLDLKANGYIPLNGAHTVTTPNLGSVIPYLAGSGLFYDTTGSVSETPQYGVDAEAGYRLPICESQIDAVRIYGGSYYFFRDNTESVLGGRARIEAQINHLVSVGARFQYDAPRGSQGFLEAKLRFPFSAKKLYQKSGLVSRLDESPERDIDIVTSAKVDTGLHKEVLNTSGTQQRILYVDNTQTNGDGTKEHPFNNLQSAQQALQANDILYIFRGDGTTHNMDQGIIIDKSNVSFIGSGSPLTINGYTFLQAGSAPTISNIQRTGVDATQSGISITAGGNSYISGVTVTGAVHGILYDFENGQIADSIKIDNVTMLNNTIRGFWLFGKNGSSVNNVTITNNKSINNGNDGIRIATDTGASIQNVTMANNTTTGNGTNGLGVTTGIDGTIGNLELMNNISNGNFNSGIRFSTGSTNSKILNSNIHDNNLNNNGQGLYILSAGANNLMDTINVTNNFMNNNSSTAGLYLNAQQGAKINTLNISNNVANGNTASATGGGIYIVSNGANTAITTLTLTNNTANNNAGTNGVTIEVASSGTLITSLISNQTALNNNQNGIFYNISGGIVSNTTVTNSYLNGNSQQGLYILNGSGHVDSATISNVSMNNNSQNGLYIRSSTATSVTDNIRVSNSNMTGNGLSGINLLRSVSTGILNVDFGGGAFGSTGQNRVFGNVSKDAILFFTGTAQTVFAQNNWWGTASGLQASRYTLTNATINSTPFLTTDPRP